MFVSLAERWGVANIFHARCVILTMSVYSLVIAREYGKGIRDAQSRNEKWIYFMMSNNKFLGKCWYGRHPWIRLAMESESMVEKGINFSVWEPPMIYLAWKVLGTTRSFTLTWKTCLPKCFYLSFSLWALAPPQIPTSLCEGPFFYFMQFLFWIWVSIFSYKTPIRGAMICS